MAVAAVASSKVGAVARLGRAEPHIGRRSGPLRRGPCSRQLQVVARSAGAGGNVIDRPTTAPGIDERKKVRSSKPPIYRVLLHDDTYNRREYVVQVLMKVVDGCTVDDAVNIMQEAHINGLALVTMCAQEDAERYCEGLRLGGLVATLEPAGPGAS